MSRVLYELTGPAYALLMGGSWDFETCPRCKGSSRIQVRNLSVELTRNEPRSVWIPDGPERLVSLELGAELEKHTPLGMYLQPVETGWFQGMEVPEDWGLPPVLVQVRTTEIIHAAPRSIRYEKCTHPSGIIRPLYVLPPANVPTYGLWRVKESGGVLLFTKAMRDLFATTDPDLTFIEVPCIDPEEGNTTGGAK